GRSAARGGGSAPPPGPPRAPPPPPAFPPRGTPPPPCLLLPRGAFRGPPARPAPPAEGAARAAQGELRHELVPAAGACRAGDPEALRDDPGRQRLELVHHGRAGSALVERRPA